MGSRQESQMPTETQENVETENEVRKPTLHRQHNHDMRHLTTSFTIRASGQWHDMSGN